MKSFSRWIKEFTSPRKKVLPSRPQKPARPFRPGLEALEDRLVPAGVQAAYAVTNNWGSGLQAQIQITNGQAQSVANWQLAFDFSANLTSIWDAKVVSHTGNHYVIAGLSYDNNLPAGGVQSFGFIASPGGTVAAPANYSLNGVALGQTSTPPPTPPPATTGNVQFQVTDDWGSGYTGQITIQNNSATAYTSWSLEFDYAGQISSIWNASIASHTGNHYVVNAASWNGAVPVGGSVSFGFNGSPGNVTAATSPANYVVHGSASSSGSTGTGSTGGSGSTTQPPVAANVSAVATTGQPVVINVLASDSDPNGFTLSVTVEAQGQDGSVVVNANGTLTYTSKAGFSGADAFSYSISDGHGGTASGTVSVTVTAAVAATAWPAHVFAPYVDMTLYPMYDLASTAKNEGIKYFTLAFITAGPNGEPAWGGYQAYDVNNGSTYEAQMKTEIAAVRALGGDVMVSFGGEAGQELAQVITSVPALAAAYSTVINDYNLTHIDFDIEGAAEGDHASIDRRSQAIAILQQQAAAAGRTLYVNFTLPVLPTGLTADGLYVLQSALKFGVNIGGVNVMAMDYGDGAAPSPKGQMGTYAIDAAQSTFNQLQALFGTTRTTAQLWQMVGVTPMIGVNDASDEVFDQAAARQLLAFAQQHGMGEIAFWSLERDQQDLSGALTYPTNTSSSILQQPFEFSLIFEAFTA